MADTVKTKQKSTNMKKNKKDNINNSNNKQKKRKHSISSGVETPSKVSCIREEFTEEKHSKYVEEEEEIHEKMEKFGGNDLQWRNLELVLSIQSKEIETHKKVELIYDFVISRAFREDDEVEKEFNTLSNSRLILYVSNWIQSLLITSEKTTRSRDKESEDSQFCFDHRCWQILKYCLEESSRLSVSLSLSRDILRVISCVARSTLHKLNGLHTDVEVSSFITTECHLYNTVNDCLKSLFNSHGRLLNGNLDLWTVTVSSLFELVIKTFAHNLQDSDVGNLIIELSCLVFEHFAKFLKVHPCRKNGFRDFVEKLLEPLLHLLGMLPEQIRDDGNPMVKNLFSFVQEIVSYGLFHLVHLDEYLSLHGTERYNSLPEWKVISARTSIKSYLRHLFDKLENLVSKRKVHALSGVGEMFQLFVNCVKKQKKDDSDGPKPTGTQSTKDSSKISNLNSEKSNTTGPGWNMRKSFFDFFVLSMEPLLLDLKKHLQSEVESKTFVADVNFALKSVNTILSTMVRERIYLRTEDNSGGACLSFFKVSYGLLLSCYAKVNQLWISKFGNDSSAQVEVLHSAAKESAFVIMNFLEIEYEVIGDDLDSTWLTILTFLAMGHSSGGTLELCPLSSVAVDLGCRVVSLYSELRQVNLALLALCKGLRHSASNQVDDIMKSSEVLPFNFSLHGDKFANSGLLLLGAQRFRLAICNAVKSIPEGQANEYVQTLSSDISDSLEWMKFTCPMTDGHEAEDSNRHHEYSVKAKILGMVLSELCSLVLDSIPVTTGNSYRTGVSLENLIGVLRPSMTLLIDPEQDGLNTFVLSVLGITSPSDIAKCKNDLQDEASLFLLFFFRLYVSCRSLYRQTLSLMPPKLTKKMSGLMADLCTAYSGDELLEMTDLVDEGYFSWVIRHSSSLLSMMPVLKDSILQNGSARFCLIYVLHIMTLQRLGDLKRQIQIVEYVVTRNEKVISSKLVDDADLSALRKKKKKQNKFLTALKEEAACLTEFIMEYLYVDDQKLQIPPLSVRTSNASDPRNMEFGSWDLGVCTVNEKTLHIAVWWIMSQNIDTWCNYASKKNLKLFLSQLICYSLPRESDGKFEDNSRGYSDGESSVTTCKISRDLLCDSSFYDQRFVCRYIVSMICDVLEKLAPSLFEVSSNNDVDLNSIDWTEALSVLSKTPVATSKQASSSQITLYVAAARSLLNRLNHMMGKALCSKSFSRCLIYVVNFERLIVGRLVDPHGTQCWHEHFELLRLLVSCRRTLRYLLTTFCEKSESYESSSLGIFSKCPSPSKWLLKSLNLVIGWSTSMSLDHNDGRVNNMIVSLMDQTSYVFFTICKRDFGWAVHWVLSPKETKVSCGSEGTPSTESSSSLKLSKDITGCKSLAMIVEALEVETKSLFPFLNEVLNNGNVDAGVPLADLNKLFSVLACVQGSLWGLECALGDIGTNSEEVKAKLKKHNNKTVARIISLLDMIVKFIGTSSQIFLCYDQSVKSSCNDQDVQNSENGSHGLVEFGSFDYKSLRMDLLQSFLDGQNLEAAYFLRRLLISSSAIIRLSTVINCSSLSFEAVQILLGCSEFLLTKFSEMLDMPKSSSFLWLDGTAQFLEALASQFPLTDPSATKDIYTKLVELNIKAIGKCISLQGKRATLASHDIESVTKLLTTSQAPEPSVIDPLYDLGLDDLKTRLRKSFRVLIEKPSELHLLSVMQALQQALTGVRVGFTTICDIQMGITDGGVVSSVVVAGVDCLDVLLESLKGNKLWSLVKTQLHGLIASLFNIVVHLQGPTLFYRRSNRSTMNSSPDSGSVVLMCVEVLTRIAGKPALFHLDFHHVSQFLHTAGTLFQSFHSLKPDHASHQGISISRDSKEHDLFLVDRQFSMNLYAASCRLLWTVIKHHRSDTIRCVFLLQASLQVLLHCLEHVSTDTTDKKGYFTWEVEEGVKCATYLRRVYEEIRQQKDDFGQHAYKFLSDYTWVLSGYGSLKNGLKREVDEALRPGVYSLIDVCSPDDLQHLHTVSGEGPRRSTLASLKHDYEHNFKYGGKV
ncbi:hypothetical protein vseg_012798 [Gypsophila vaccaria]